MIDGEFTGRAVLVVGGSSGIGNGIARAFREQGATVHVWGTRPSASDYDGEDGSDLDGLSYDRVDAADAAAVEAYAPPFDALDVLVCAQGTVLYGGSEFGAEGWERVLSVNLDSVMTVARRFKPMLAARGGSMVTVSSVAGYRAAVGQPAYTASKHGVIGLTKALAAAFARDGIRVNGIAPGLVDTKLTKPMTADPKRLEQALAVIPQRRLGTPADMAGVCLFLASPQASYVCGQTITVDGGLTLA